MFIHVTFSTGGDLTARGFWGLSAFIISIKKKRKEKKGKTLNHQEPVRKPALADKPRKAPAAPDVPHE